MIRISNDPQVTPETLNAPPVKKRKRWLPFGICATAIILVVAIVLGVVSTDKPPKVSDCLIYYKDGEMFFLEVDAENRQPIQITQKFDAADKKANCFTINKDCSVTCDYLSNDGEKLLFVECNNNSPSIKTMYYKNLKRPDEKFEKIDIAVDKYIVNESEELITYNTSTLKELYQYDFQTKTKTKIAEAVDEFKVTDSGERIIYNTLDGGLFLKESGEKAEKISSGVYSIKHVNASNDMIFYGKKDGLYKKNLGENEEKIVENGYEIQAVYDTGEVYFTRSNEVEFSFFDVVEDDMKEADEKIKNPTYEEYKDWDKYYEAFDEYEKKLNRDLLRRELANEKKKVLKRSLYYYYDGETKLISENMDWVKCVFAEENAVVAFMERSPKEGTSFKLSDYENLAIWKSVFSDFSFSKLNMRIANKGKVSRVEGLEERNFNLDSRGETFYYVSARGNLYKHKITDDAVQKLEVYDTNVIDYFILEGSDDVVYYKDAKKIEKGLYINKQLIDKDVYAARSDYDKAMQFGQRNGLSYIRLLDGTKKFLYNTKRGDNPVRIYENGKITKTPNGVRKHVAMTNGQIVYLNVSEEYGKHKLYLYENGKRTELDSDVSDIFYAQAFKGQGAKHNVYYELVAYF